MTSGPFRLAGEQEGKAAKSHRWVSVLLALNGEEGATDWSEVSLWVLAETRKWIFPRSLGKEPAFGCSPVRPI